MPQSAVDKIPPGPKLDALTAEKVFGWKNVHKHEGSLVGKKQDKAGRWRLAKVPQYSTNVGHAYAIEDQMKRRKDTWRGSQQRAMIHFNMNATATIRWKIFSKDLAF